MAKIRKIEPVMPTLPTRKKVAAYARVSMETERLHHSLSAQVSYYSDLIQRNPEWEYAGVYADDGISGTRIRYRDEFQRMLNDCEAGKIDIILTKSISRFARNTVDLLSIIRHLKELNIEVRFEEQNINTLSGEGELMLTILASFAQEESISMSQNIKWAKQKQAEKGEMTNSVVPYGYCFDPKTKSPSVVPEQAEVVRMIFDDFVNHGLSDYQITNKLIKSNIPTCRGGNWTQTTVRRMLKNVTYTGNMLLGKYYSPDPLLHIHAPNNGEAPQYYVEGSHPAIIDKDLFDKAQEIFKWRSGLPKGHFTGGTFNQYSRKIICRGCGRPFGRCINRMRGGKRFAAWTCKKPGGKCLTPLLLENELDEISNKILGISSFDAAVFTQHINHIEVGLDDKIYYYFNDGALEEFQFIRRKKSPLKKRRGL